jgi:hypothetical protein
MLSCTVTVAAWSLTLPTLHLLAALEENKFDNNSKWRGSAAPDWGPSCRVRGSREREAVLMRRFFTGFRADVAVALLLICKGEFR